MNFSSVDMVVDKLKQRMTVFAKIDDFPCAYLYPRGEQTERIA